MAETEKSCYEEIAEETKAAVLQYAREEWPVIKTSSGVEVSCSQLPGVPVKVYKAVGEIDCPPSETLRYVSSPGFGICMREEWDKQIKHWEILEKIDERTLVLRTCCHSAVMGIIAQREFIDVVRNETSCEESIDGGLCFTCGRGVDYPFPEDSSYVRGWNHHSAILCFPKIGDASKTRMVYLVQSDLKGMLPAKLIESVLPTNQVNFIKSVRKAVSEDLLGQLLKK